MRFKHHEIEMLLDLQESLNDNFTVSRWDEALVSTALICEYAEFLNEIPAHWKVWKKVPDDNIDNAKVEFIDCVHFMLSLLLIRIERDDWIPDDQTKVLNTIPQSNLLDGLNISMTSFLYHKSTPLSIQYFNDFVDYTTSFLGMSKEEFFKYFSTKMKINEERAKGGYLEGTYEGKELEQNRFNEQEKLSE